MRAKLLDMSVQWPGGFDLDFGREMHGAVGAVRLAVGTVLARVNGGEEIVRGGLAPEERPEHGGHPTGRSMGLAGRKETLDFGDQEKRQIYTTEIIEGA